MPPERRLSNITPLPRQAFLLFSLEGFSEEEVAFILGIDVAETRRLADAAGRELAAEIATDVLIIEDETFIAMDLESLVKNLGHHVIGVARTHSDAVALAKNKKPGLILADIQLADGSSGLDAVNELLRTFEVPVVFITAYPERFLTGERPEPAFLISKPFQPAMVSAVASQALFFQRNSRTRTEGRGVLNGGSCVILNGALKSAPFLFGSAAAAHPLVQLSATGCLSGETCTLCQVVRKPCGTLRLPGRKPQIWMQKNRARPASHSRAPRRRSMGQGE